MKSIHFIASSFCYLNASSSSPFIGVNMNNSFDKAIEKTGMIALWRSENTNPMKILYTG
jgi:hypothetical protein